MSNTKRFIRTTAEAKAAPVGTIVLLTNETVRGRRVASQKHDDNTWYISSGWEMSDGDRSITGEVLVWGEVKSGRTVTDANDAPAAAHEETEEVVAYRGRVVANLNAHADLLGYQLADQEHIAGVRAAAARIDEGLV